MVIIKQVYDNSCVLACLQSFLADVHITKSQSQLITDWEKFCDKAGTVWLERFTEFCAALSLACVEILHNENLIDVQADESVFIVPTEMFCRPNSRHCVRYHSYIDNKS